MSLPTQDISIITRREPASTRWPALAACLALLAGLGHVTEAAGTSCNYEVTPALRSHGYGATAATVSVNTGGNCGWFVVNTNTWISITAGASGTGPGAITYSLAGNGNPAARAGVIHVVSLDNTRSATFTITQAGLVCAYSLSPSTRDKCYGYATGTVQVTTQGPCMWTVENPTDWIIFTAAQSGTGSGKIHYSVLANLSPNERTGVVMIGGQPLTIRQAARPFDCAPDKTVACGAAWDFDAPVVTGTNVTVRVVSTVTNVSCGSAFTATREWELTDRCGDKSFCSQTVSQLNSPINISCPPALTVSTPDGVPPRPQSLAEFQAAGGVVGMACASALQYRCVDGPFTGTSCQGAIERTHIITDGCLNSASCVQIISVQGSSLPVTARDDSAATAQNTSFTLPAATLLANDADPLNGALNILSVSGSSSRGGVVTLSGAGVQYSPPLGFVGIDTFTYTVRNECGSTASATVTVTISRLNNAPVANHDSVSTEQGVTLAIDTAELLANDRDADGDPLTIVSVSLDSAQGGTVRLVAGNIIYIPRPGFSGADTFTYTADDGQGGTATATVTVNVIRSNQSPIINDDRVSTDRNAILTIPAATLLANDSDPDGDALTIVNVSNTSAKGGSVLLLDGKVIYTPPADFIGTDTFTYTADDGHGGTSMAIVTVTVRRPNSAPVANHDNVVASENTPLTIPALNLLLNDVDADGDFLTIVSVSDASAQGGTVQLIDGNILYTPPHGFIGADTFSYTVDDGQGGDSTAMVTVTVSAAGRPSNSPPVVAGMTVQTPINTAISVTRANLLALATDADGDALTVVSAEVTGLRAALVLSSSSVAVTPQLNFLGTFEFTFVVGDGRGGFGTGTVTVVVQPVPLTFVEGKPVLNPQTGLFEQPVTVVNAGSSTIMALKLGITGLRTNIRVWNASGTDAGVPYVQYNHPLDPGQSMVVRIEYYVPDRLPFTPVLTMTPVMPLAGTAGGISSAGSMAIDNCHMDLRLGGEPRFVIEFTSIPDRTYTIIYSDDSANWAAATPSVTATANRTQWYNDGPPKTQSKPASKGARFYRVILAP